MTSAAAGDRLLSVDEARDAVLAAIAGPTEPETAFLSEARGRILAEEVAIGAVARQDLQPELAHFVGGLQTILDPFGRLIGVAGILR